MKLMSLDPFKITCPSVSCTNEFPDDILKASKVVFKSSPADLHVISASQTDIRLVVAK